MKAMDFEEITRPTAAAKYDTLLLCENAPKSRKRVRLLYSDGTMSSVIEVDSKELSEKSKQFCTRLLEFIFPKHRFLKVNDLDEIKIMMKLMVHDIQTTPSHAAKLLHVQVRDIEDLIAQNLLQTAGGKVSLEDVKNLIDKGYTGGITLVQ
jgi:hypothetical protein